MKDPAASKPVMYDSQREILDAATDKLFQDMWAEIASSYTEEVLTEERDKYLDIELFGRLASTSYDVARFPEDEFLKIVNKACKAMYEGEDFSKAPLYLTAVGLRRIWEGNQEYLSSKNVQLNSIESPLPSGEEIRTLLHSKMENITSALIKVKEEAPDFKAKVTYVAGILNKNYIPELEIDYSKQSKSF